MFPKQLQEAIQKEIQGKRLTQASLELTGRYREVTDSQKLQTLDQKLAYLAVRMPATFAAISRVLEELPLSDVRSLIDLGAGPGTVLWATTGRFPLEKIILIERDQDLINLGRKLASTHFLNAKWMREDFSSPLELPQADLVTLSYSLGELSATKQEQVILKAWSLATQALVIIEPGTPKGFEVIRKARQRLIDAKAFLLAPCPHSFACPMPNNDWCHFSTRLERVKFHRVVKDVSLSYEDEKFSYCIAIRQPTTPYTGRIVRHPQKRSGHIQFTVCAQNGHLESSIISRKQGERYSQAKKLEWGDQFI